MTERDFYDGLVWAWLALGVVTFATLFFVTAPYGRHARAGWGPSVPFVPGWMLMEGPSALGLAVWFALGTHPVDAASLMLLGVWELHYVYRAFVDPWLRRGRAQPIPASVVAMAALFNVVNTYLNGRWLFALGPTPASLATAPTFYVGLALFAAGFAMNVLADRTLRRLRAPGETGYKIPRGALYRLVSCPNYLGEILEWVGFAAATSSPGAAVFAVWTFANLAPRARSHHAWYRAHFPDYPRERRALIPYVW